MYCLKFLFVCLLLQIYENGALKILVVSPIFGRSHSQFMGNLADLYVKNSHDVVYFEPEIIDDDHILKFNSSKLARVILKKKDWVGTNAFAQFQNQGWSMKEEGIFDAVNTLTAFTNAMASSCKSILNDEPLLSQLRAEKFDIGIAEFLTMCPYALYKKIGITKYITASATPIGASFASLFGVPAVTSLSHIPEFFNCPPVRMSFGERLGNYVVAMLGDILFGRLFFETVMKEIQKHYPDVKFEEVVANSSYVFVNADEHIDFPRPISHKFIQIAGVGVAKAKSLPQDYQTLLDKSKGTILVSFGSIAQSYLMPTEIKQAFLDSFAQFPDIQFLWKYENSSENVAGNHPNVETREWTPQVDLMNHEKLIGFVTHGGMNSLIEASNYGIPTICIPLFGDQTRNCRMTEERKLGINLPKTEMTKEKITAALSELVRDEKYLKQAREVAKMIKKRPMSTEQRVIKYTEFAAEFDISSNLNDYGSHQTTIQFYNIDVVGLLALIFITVLVILITLSFVLLRCLFRLGRRLTKSKLE